MISAIQIRELIESYAREGDIKAFVRSFSQMSFNIRQNGQPTAVKLAQTVEAKLAELYVGHGSHQALHSWAKEFVHPSPVGYYVVSSTESFFNSVNRPAEVEKAFPESAATSGTLCGVVFGSEVPVQG